MESRPGRHSGGHGTCFHKSSASSTPGVHIQANSTNNKDPIQPQESQSFLEAMFAWYLKSRRVNVKMEARSTSCRIVAAYTLEGYNSLTGRQGERYRAPILSNTAHNLHDRLVLIRFDGNNAWLGARKQG
jgi:hypothetical protein